MLPLTESAVHGDLAVFWSVATLREVSKVVCRHAALKTLHGQQSQEIPLGRALRIAIDGAAERLERRVSEVEHIVQYVIPASTLSNDLFASVPDPSDTVLLQTALDSEAYVLLTLDQRHLPHGAVIAGIQCWHPDAFLTLFYQQNPHAYRRVVQFVRTAGPILRTPLL